FHSTLSAPPRPTLFPYTTLFRSPDEPIAIRIEARYGQGAGEKTLWLPKRPEPNRVVDDGISISHPTRVQDVLEIEGVLLDFPEAPLGVAEHVQPPPHVGLVAELDFPNFDRLIEGNEKPRAGSDPLVFGLYARVAEAMGTGAREFVNWLGHRLPGDGPIVAVVSV